MCCSVACHRYGRTASVTAMLNDLKWETLDTRRNNQKKQKIGHDQIYQVPYARTDVYKYSLPCNCMYVECTTSIGDPVWDTPSKQVSVITTATEPCHVTIDHQCVILDHRELHFTGRWEDELFPQNLSKMYKKNNGTLARVWRQRCSCCHNCSDLFFSVSCPCRCITSDEVMSLKASRLAMLYFVHAENDDISMNLILMKSVISSTWLWCTICYNFTHTHMHSTHPRLMAGMPGQPG